MDSFPALVPLPPQSIIDNIPSQEWAACVEAWLGLVRYRLQSTSRVFDRCGPSDVSGVTFLRSYFDNASLNVHNAPNGQTLALGKLRRYCFLLARRYLLELPSPPSSLLTYDFLGNLCIALFANETSKTLLQALWEKSKDEISHSIDLAKSALVRTLGSTEETSSEALHTLRQLTALGKVLLEAGNVLTFGSDFLDKLSDCYKDTTQKVLRDVVLVNAYVALHSLIAAHPPHTSSLLDHFFDLKASADQDLQRRPRQATLLSALVCETPLLKHIERHLAVSNMKRGAKLLESLHVYQAQMMSLHHKRPHGRRQKGRGKQNAKDGEQASEVHVHKMSLITQLQDLFPDLGSGYIVTLLDAFSDDIEQVTAKLLEPDTLPPHLQNVDQTEMLPEVYEPRFSPRPTPPESPPLPSRRNVFDDDDFSKLRISDSRLHYGRKDSSKTADTILSDRSQHSSNKAAILSALAAFDSDDDERDDTYDMADVGGTVDSALPGSDDAEVNPIKRADDKDHGAEEMLFKAYRSDPGQFGRDPATRRSKARETLKKDAGMTDETIEGWAIMLSRDPRRLRRLEAKYALSAGGQQAALQSAAYRRPDSGTATEESDLDHGEVATRGALGNGRVRGRGRGRGNGRGAVAGPANDRGTQVARQRKDANKGSRANHNRRDQRAKKMARGGLLG